MIYKSNLYLMIFISMCTFMNAQEASFQSFDETKIVYSDEGNGKAIVLIHGFINSRKSWDNTILKRELLSKGYRVIVPDLRGNGDSDKPYGPNAYSNDAEVKDLMALATHLGLKKYLAVGYSRGSIVLAKLLTQDKRIKKAVIGGMGIDFTNPQWDRRIMFAEAFDGNVTAETEGAVNYAKSINADLKSLYLQQKHQPVTSLKELKTIKVKVLVIAGDLDTDNGDPGALQKEIPNSELKIIKGDHNGAYKTAQFSKAICSFL